MKQSTESSKPAKIIPPKLDYRSMVSVDDMPELFVSFDSKFTFNETNRFVCACYHNNFQYIYSV